MEAAWPGLAVEDSNLTVQIAALRRALGEVPGGESWIATLPRRGYRFVGPAVTKSEDRVPGTPTVDAATRPAPMMALALPDKPSIAVLPFDNLSGDSEQGYFADGLVAEIITALNRIGWLFVVARSSSAAYRGQPLDPKEVGRELGVRYLLEGSIRRAGGRLRIAAHLIDALSGALLWADSLDGWIEDALGLQDKVALSVAGGIEPVLVAAEVARSAASHIDDLGAYDLYLRARAILLSSARQIPEALHLAELAISRDPRYGPALAWAAICCYRLILDGRSEHPALHRLKGTDFARRALEVAGDDMETRANAAAALSFFGEDIDAMTTAIHHAVKLNPSFARGWSLSAMRRVWAGQLDLAIEHAETALQLSPRARVGTPLLAIGAAHFLNRRFDEAVPKLLLAIQDDPGFPEPHRFLAACYAQMGRLHSAREIVARLQTITSPLITGASCLRHPRHRELFFSGLHLAARHAPTT